MTLEAKNSLKAIKNGDTWEFKDINGRLLLTVHSLVILGDAVKILEKSYELDTVGLCKCKENSYD